jgi:hypothetical protein
VVFNFQATQRNSCRSECPSSSKRRTQINPVFQLLVPSLPCPQRRRQTHKNTFFPVAQVRGRPPAQLAFWGPVRGLAAVSNPIMMHREPAVAVSLPTHSRKH